MLYAVYSIAYLLSCHHTAIDHMSGFNYSEHVKLEDLLKDEEEYFRILRADAEDTSEQAELYRESGTDSAPSVPLFTLKEYAYTASWSWEATSDTCAICTS
jgi:hypothetical protein